MQSPSELQSADSSDATSMLEALRESLQKDHPDRFEELWMQAIEDSEQGKENFVGLISVADDFMKKVDAEGKSNVRLSSTRLGPLLELLLSVVDDSTPAEEALRLHWHLLRLFPQKREYANAFAERFESTHPVVSAERAFYQVCGFPSCPDPVSGLKRLERLLKFREGAHVQHGSGWGVGRVVAVDPFLKQVKVDLEQKQGHRVAIDAIDSILEPLDPGSFTVLRHTDSPELARLRDEDPVRLVELVLDDHGNPLATKQLKEVLVPGVVEAKQWTKWWTRAKNELRNTGHFRIGDRSPYLVEKVEDAISYADDLAQQFARVDWRVGRKIARQVARKSRGELASAWPGVREQLIEHAKSSQSNLAVEAALILQRGSDGEDVAVLEEVLGRLSPQQIEEAVRGTSAADEQRCAVAAVLNCRPEDWREVLVLFVYGKSDSLRTAAIDAVEEKEPAVAAETVSQLLSRPQSGPEAFAYCVEAVLKGSQKPSLQSFRDSSESELLAVAFDLLDHLHHRSQREGAVPLKETVFKVFAVLSFKRYEFFSRAFTEMGPERRRDVHRRIVENPLLTHELRAGLLIAALDIDPALETVKPPAPWEEEDVIYVTAEGLERRQAEFREIMEEKLPANFEAIGRAREFGDLSENAEYTSALEERDQLTKRATAIKAELDIARILDPDSVSTDEVTLGARVRLLNVATTTEIDYAILGPWDGDPEGGVLSYRSPLASAVLGRAVGDEFVAVLPAGSETFRVLAISSYFE